MEVKKSGRIFIRKGEKSTLFGNCNLDGKQYKIQLFPNFGENEQFSHWGGTIKLNEENPEKPVDND